jgi:uncharacterized protein
MTKSSIKRATLVLAASMIALAFPAANSFADVESGVKKYQAGDFKGAVAEWSPLATKGDANAAFNLGQTYRLGRGVSQDVGKSVSFYEQAAKNGHVAAQGNLGTLLYFSASPVQNRKKAVEWWHTAAQNGDNRAQYMLGVLYFNGDDVEKDWAKAYAYTSMAKDSGLKEAESSLTEMTRHLAEADVQKGTLQKSKLVSNRAVMANTTPPVLKETGASKPVVAWNTAATVAPQGQLPATNAEVVAAALPTPVNSAPASLPTVYTGAVPAGQAAAAASIGAPTPAAPVAQTAQAEEPAAPTPAVPLSGWRVQLGAFGTQNAAQSAWALLQRKASSTLSNSAPSFEPAGNATRLLVAGFDSRSAANGLCGRLKSQGVTCFVKAN